MKFPQIVCFSININSCPGGEIGRHAGLRSQCESVTVRVRPGAPNFLKVLISKMRTTHCDDISEGDNVIVGLGDSFTQGVGAYDWNTWKYISENPDMYDAGLLQYVEEQGKNNWVRQLRDRCLPDYKVFNLGITGIGNRAAVKELYLNPLPKNLGNVIVVLLASGLDRFDLLKQIDNISCHQKWQTIWPSISDKGPISLLEKQYLDQIWSPRNDALEFLLSVCEAQHFCKSNNYRFLFASVFDSRISKNQLSKDLKDKSDYVDIVDWNNFIDIPNRESLMDMISQIEGNKYRSMYDIYIENSSTKMPSKYITPCSHWTIEGQLKIAEYLFEQFQTRKLISPLHTEYNRINSV